MVTTTNPNVVNPAAAAGAAPAGPTPSPMDPMQGLVKAVIYLGAAELTIASLTAQGKLTTMTAPSQDISDPSLRGLNVEVAEEFKCFELFLISRFNLNMEGYAPNVSTASAFLNPSNVSGLISGFGPILQQFAPIIQAAYPAAAPIIQAVLGAISAAGGGGSPSPAPAPAPAPAPSPSGS